MSRSVLVAQTEFESETYADNFVRVEVLDNGTSVYTAYNSKKELVA